LKVKLISHSQAPDFNESALDLVAYCARVSNPDNQNNKETSEKLVKYLMKHKHWSPLEMVSACLEIETTRDIARQILRHRSFSFQEFSQRYADPTKDLDFEVREARLQDPKNRQNSVVTDDVELQAMWEDKQRSVINASLDAYRMYVNGTLRSWIHYIELRGANGTQKEHIEIAHAVATVITQIFPISLQNESV